MRIEMLATEASPEGVLHAGHVYDLPKKKAESLLKRGQHGQPYARVAPDKTVRAEKISTPADGDQEDG